ncbi:MAG: hypothetical protein KID00_14690 [Clostridium argentinense]|uniref:Uncharacterized protein n=1 Tax=Clostridium faecium TaxID=2762223 RepID=A0ABR8YSN2_9CLOT|nr:MULTISPECIES: hypothetical protein [Clostridium]MBD8046884.1 hypothetical protein [Clostridium faecium]MBS5825070.1 hypothetical protein [Clostridium argentinense]MDU1349849.1 hypothetical protein [Clostridium argentinense]
MRGKILTTLASSILNLITAGFYIVNNEFKVLPHNSLFFTILHQQSFFIA